MNKTINLSNPTSCVVAPADFDISELSNEQAVAFRKFQSGQNIFVTGPGGTGKTKLISYMYNYANLMNKPIQVCALTGCAAILLKCNALTIHLWSGIKIARGSKDQVVDSVLKNKYAMKNWKKVKILVIDEVSMLSVKIFEILDEIGKSAKKCSLPFGGIQVVLTGDFFQLPPVPTMGEPNTEKMCFESEIWSKTFPLENHIELKTMFRQTDPKYTAILSNIRKGIITEADNAVLFSYVKREIDLEKTNGIVPIKIFAVRNKVDCVNRIMYEKIEEEEHIIEPFVKTDCDHYLETSLPIRHEILQNCKQLNEKDIQREIEYLTGNMPCSNELHLKKGCKVMCTVNYNMELGICNGSQGVVTDFVTRLDSTGRSCVCPIVKFSNGIIQVIQPFIWQSEDTPTIAILQIPLQLAWAVTIHKIQGATLAMAEMDIGKSVFEYGQIYVALSRIQTLDGLYLLEFNPAKIRANPKVVEFYRKLEQLRPATPPSPPKPPSSDTKSLDFENYKYIDPQTKVVPIVKKETPQIVKKL